MCNGTLWPLLHYESNYVRFSEDAWQAYLEVNRQFARVILEIAKEDDLIWIHDFHLFFLPRLLKRKNKNLKVGFFLHTPFPSSEIFRQLPVRKEILEGVLSADLVGMHDYSYLRHFCSSIFYVLGLESSMLSVRGPEHSTTLGVFPVSIDTPYFESSANSTEVKQHLKKLNKTKPYELMILGVDRLDYIKGIRLKLEAFRALLSKHSELVGRVGLLQLAVPSRTDVEGYQSLRSETERLVGEINGTFGKPNYVPVQYLFASTDFSELLALYRSAQVLLVTSKRDGMNLVALEYLAAQKQSEPGVVVLSEFTGAVSTLSHVLPTNPWDINGTSDVLYRALTMNRTERISRHSAMLNYMRGYTATHWAESFLKVLDRQPSVEVQGQTFPIDVRNPNDSLLQSVVQSVQGKSVVVFLDYDGTLVSLSDNPTHAILDEKARDVVSRLVQDERINLVIISGRARRFLQEQFEGIPVTLAAEHGSRYLQKGDTKWKTLVRSSHDQWIERSERIMADYTARVPGSYIEKKHCCIVWHHRLSPGEFGDYQARKLKQDLDAALLQHPASVLTGKKVVEVRAVEANKGMFASWYIQSHFKDLSGIKILGIGDDETDEELFDRIIQAGGLTFKVGSGLSRARYRIETRDEVLEFLEIIRKAVSQ